ncbi:MAG: hypothetical protein O3C27_15510 [Actinomycetota bacterium]|nr:hypothetical protein [Actinomycetota bacterium]
MLCEAPGQAGGFGLSDRGRAAYLLFEGERPVAFLGPALRWAARESVDQLVILTDAVSAGVLARRVGLLAVGSVEVRSIVGTLTAPAAPSERLIPPDLGADIWALAGLINESGARPVNDHGRLVAEWAGLEVARVSRDEQGRPLIEVGVGQADRELHQLVHSGLSPDAALRRAVAAVAVHRRAGARPHPLNRLARERWLRSALLDQPALLGLTELYAEPPLEPRSTVLGHRPVAAKGRTADGSVVVVVCSSGVDLDLAPQAADYRDRVDPAARLLVVVPHADHYPITEELVGLIPDTELRSMAPPWGDPGDDSAQ